MKSNRRVWCRSVLSIQWLASVLLCAAFALPAAAADVYWSGKGDGVSWNDAANWQGGAVPAGTGDAAYFTVPNNGITVNHSGTFTIRQLFVYVPTTITIPSGCTLYLSNSGGAVIDAAADVTIDGPGDLSLSTSTGYNYADVRPYAGATITISARITGVAGVENNSAGTIMLANPQNSYPGMTYITVAGGTIAFPTMANAGTASAIGAGDHFFATVANTTFRYTGTAAASTDRSFVLSGTPVAFEQAGTGAVTLNSTVTNISAGSRTFILRNTSSAAATFAGRLADGLGTLSLLKEGAGTWTLTTANAYSGTTTISGGTLEVANLAALGTGALTLSGGTLALNPSAAANYSATLPDVTVSGSGRITIPAASGSSTLTFAGLTGAGAVLTIDAPSAGTAANRIFVTGLADGAVDWIRINGAPAQYDSLNGLMPASTPVTTGIAARGDTIPNTPGAAIAITTPGTAGPVTLAAPLIEIVTLSQQEPATAADIDFQGGTLAADQVGIATGAAALTLANGTLTATGVYPTSGISGLNTVTTAPLTDDASTGISTAKIYTHAIDFGNQGAATINGVPFTQVNSAAGTLGSTPYGWADFPTGLHNNMFDWIDTVPETATGLRALLNDMVYAGSATRVKLTGLTPGAIYELRFYTRSWDGLANAIERNNLYSFYTSPNAVPVAQFAFDKNKALPTVLIFRYLAASSELAIASSTLSITANPWSGFYGITNELLADAPTAFSEGQTVLALDNASGAPLTVSADLADNGRSVSLIRSGTGPVILSGSVSHTGVTLLDGDLTLAPPAGTAQTISTLHGPGGLIKDGAGTTFLQSANTYSGSTLIRAGMLRIANSTALGSDGAGTTVESGGALVIGDAPVNTLAIKDPITLAGAGPDGLGALRNDSVSQQQNAFQSRFTLSADTTIGGTAATPYIPFSNGKGSFNLRNGTLDLAGHTLTKSGPGAFLISASQVLNAPGTGAINITGGALGLDGNTCLAGSAANAITVGPGANLDFWSVPAPLQWTLNLEDGAHLSSRSASKLSENVIVGPVNLLGGQALFSGTGTVTIESQISGPGGIIKANGTTYLRNAANTYTGPTAITNGTLYAAMPDSISGLTTDKLTVSNTGALIVPYSDDPAFQSLAWTENDILTIATPATFLHSTTALGLDTCYGDAAYTGAISGFGISKYGSGTLTLTAPVNTVGDLRICDGGLILDGGSYDLLNNASVYFGTAGSASLTTLTLKEGVRLVGHDRGYNLQPISLIGVGHFANSRGILTIPDNAFVQGRLFLGDNETGAGAIYQTGGVFLNTGGGGPDGRIGQNGYGYYRLDGGAVTNKGYTQLGYGGKSIGILHQTGGSFVFNSGTTAASGVGGDDPAAYYGGSLATRGGAGLFHITGGTLDTGGTRLGLCEWDGINSYNDGYGILTIEGDALVKPWHIDMADRNAAPVAVINLNGGILQTRYFYKGRRNNPAAATAVINFNGGTFRAVDSRNIFSDNIDFDNPLRAIVGAGGAVIDTAEQNISMNLPLQASEDYGVTGIRVVTPGAGYIAPPFVKITGGGGYGATAVAEIDRETGTLTNIRVTSPGTGYTAIPTATLTGGGCTTAATVGLVTVGASPSDGGLTKLGSGILTLSGANTWRGPTTIKEGSVDFFTEDALPAASELVIDGGTANLSGQTLTNAFTALTSGSIVNGTLVTAALRKEGDGEALLNAGLTVTADVAPVMAPTPGLWEGVIFSGWDYFTPNPKTSIVLTTRAGNGAKAYNSTYADGSWMGNHHTWVYSGYIWNNESTNVTWKWCGTFDDNVMLKIDRAVVFSTGNGGTTVQHTLKPGPHAIEIRFGDGTGQVGPNADVSKLGGLTYDTGDGLGWRLLADPGDGSLLTVDLGPYAQLPPSTELPAEVAQNVGDLAAEYSLVYASDVPNTGSAINSGNPYYIDNSGSAALYDRVAYYLELTRGNETQWVWVSFDSTDLDRALIGYPIANNKTAMQMRLTNMDVRSNLDSITDVVNCQTGNIEFWPNNYSQDDPHGLGAAVSKNNTGYDFGDTMSGGPATGAGHGSMQIHNHGEGTVLFALSNFGNGNGTLGLGIGNQTVTGDTIAPDWTFAANAANYTTKRLYVFTRDIQLDAQPSPPVSTVAEGTLRLGSPYAGLYEGMIPAAWDVTTANPQTSVQLTTRAGNGAKAGNGFYANGLWAGNYHTWVYTGYIWNRTGAPVTWTWRGTFDDNVMLKIGGITVFNTGNGGDTKTHTLPVGASSIEIRFGDGIGNVGPNADITNLGGLTYDTGDGQGWRLLADPGDGSLLTIRVDSPPVTTFADTDWDIASGATLDLGGQTVALGTIGGDGTLANGTLGAGAVISPAGDGAIGTLSLNGVALGDTVEYRADVGSDATSDLVTTEDALDVTGMRVTLNNPAALQYRYQYTLIQAAGGITGIPDASALPDKWALLKKGNELFLFYPSGTLMILR